MAVASAAVCSCFRPVYATNTLIIDSNLADVALLACTVSLIQCAPHQHCTAQAVQQLQDCVLFTVGMASVASSQDGGDDAEARRVSALFAWEQGKRAWSVTSRP